MSDDLGRTSASSVTVLACHYDSGQSMRRYGELLTDAYRSAGWQVRVVSPTRALSSRVRAPGPHKLAVYLEKLVLFPLRLAFGSRGIDPLVHVTDHSDAPWLRRIGGATRSLVTCHDLIAIRAGDGLLDAHRPRWSGRLYQRYIASSLRRASMILAVSDTTLGEVRSTFVEVPSRLLHNPLPPEVTRAVVGSADRPIDAPFLLVVASSNWRKRRHLALEAWRRIRAVAGDSLQLVLVGDPLTSTELQDLDPEGPPPQHTVLSDVTDTELAGLYAAAEGVLQLSSHEGFGWPIVEANYWGTVTVCSDLPVFHEVGPSNVFVGDDLDEVDWAAVWRDLHDERRRDAVRADAARFSPEVFADELTAAAAELRGAPDERRARLGAPGQARG